MVARSSYAIVIEQVLCQCAQLYAIPQRSRTLLAFDRDHGQFVLIDEGWEGYRRIHSTWAHVELRDGQILVHEDGSEVGIANLLIAAGVPHDDIILAFRAPLKPSTITFAAA
jgi:hypothetical protein